MGGGFAEVTPYKGGWCGNEMFPEVLTGESSNLHQAMFELPDPTKPELLWEPSTELVEGARLTETHESLEGVKKQHPE